MRSRVTAVASATAVLLLGTVASGPAAHAACAPNVCSTQSTSGFGISAGDGPRFDDLIAGADGQTPQESYPVVGNFGPVTLNGAPQLTTAEIPPFTVVDDSGAGAGWHVTLQVTDFSDGLVLPAQAHVVDASLMSMNGPVIAPGTATAAMGGVWSKGWDAGFKVAREICIADPADADHNGGAPLGGDGSSHVAGMGVYVVSPQVLKLVVPEDTTPATYTASATIVIASGP